MSSIKTPSNTRILCCLLLGGLIVLLAPCAASADSTNPNVILVQVKPPQGFPGDGIVIARPSFPKKPAVAKKQSVVDITVAKDETASLNKDRAKVVKAYAEAKAHFVEIYAFNGTEITKKSCADAEAKAWDYLGTLPQEVQDAYGGKPPTLICTGGR